jgi:hypothetical protein
MATWFLPAAFFAFCKRQNAGRRRFRLVHHQRASQHSSLLRRHADMELTQMEQSESVRMMINIPADVRAWIMQESRREDRTMNATITRAIRAQMREQAEQRGMVR